MTKLGYIGHSAFTLQHDDLLIVIDPFITGNPVAKITASDISPDLIFLTHAHNDHVGDTIGLAERTGATVVCITELADILVERGVNVIDINLGGTYRFDGGSVKLVPAWHTSTWIDESGAVTAPTTPAGLVIKLGEGRERKTLYFAGDTCLFMDMQLIGDEELDLAVVPIGDHYTMGPDDALKAVKFLRPKVVIPCHYNTFPPIEQDAGAFKAQVEKQTQAACRLLKPGESWEIGTSE